VNEPAAKGIYIAAPEGATGKSIVALGLIDLLARRVGTIGVFRPVVRSSDPAADLLGQRLVGGLGGAPAHRLGIGTTYAAVHHDPDAAMEAIIAAYRALHDACDMVVVVGSDYTDVAGPTEFSFNGRVATNLATPVVLVVSAHGRTAGDVAQVVDMALAEITDAHATTIGVVANRCDPARLDEVVAALEPTGLPAYALPEVPILSAPRLDEIADALDAELCFGDPEALAREVVEQRICAMTVEHILARVRPDQLCIVAGDRSDVLVALVAAHVTPGMPSLAGIVLDGGYRPGPEVTALVGGMDQRLPILLTDHDSFRTAQIVAETRGLMATGTQRKTDVALSTFEQHIDTDAFTRMLEVHPSDVVTPLMFESMLVDLARTRRRRIVLPEGTDERILRATSTLLERQVADIVLLGPKAKITTKAAALGLDIAAAEIIDPDRSELLEPFAVEYARLRAHRGIEVDVARDLVRGVSYFWTMMVQSGHADGMVSGATHSTAHTITPAFQIIKTVPGSGKVSSVFFMCLADRVLVYGDCAVIPDPTAEELAEIAVASADTAARFGVEPRVAMLSYSTGESGTGADVDKVRTATELVTARRPDLPVAGPMQYDAAVDSAVGEAKLPGSPVAGRATVFIFPDLNTGNNTYKAVQRSAGAVAIGPVLQGLRKPVNDLSRGATVRDIINTVAITAAQA
jgi:phosphate acetyltransferase